MRWCKIIISSFIYFFYLRFINAKKRILQRGMFIWAFFVVLLIELSSQQNVTLSNTAQSITYGAVKQMKDFVISKTQPKMQQSSIGSNSVSWICEMVEHKCCSWWKHFDCCLLQFEPLWRLLWCVPHLLQLQLPNTPRQTSELPVNHLLCLVRSTGDNRLQRLGWPCGIFVMGSLFLFPNDWRATLIHSRYMEYLPWSMAANCWRRFSFLERKYRNSICLEW